MRRKGGGLRRGANFSCGTTEGDVVVYYYSREEEQLKIGLYDLIGERA